MTLVQLGESADSRGIENRAKMTNPTLDFADDFCKRGIVHIFAALSSPPAAGLAELGGHSPAVTGSSGA